MTCEARDPPVDLTGPDLEAASCGSSKRSHRPADDIWDHFKKVKLDPATAKIQHRNYNAVCKGCDNTIAGKPEIMKRHLVNCSKASTHSQQDAIRSQAKRSASDISEAGSQQSGFLLKNDYLISDSRTSTDLDFDHPALTQVTAPPPIARVQLGDNTEQYDLDNLVSKD